MNTLLGAKGAVLLQRVVVVLLRLLTTACAELAAFAACSPSDDVVARPEVIARDESCLERCGAAGCPCPSSQPIRTQLEDGTQFAIDATEATIESYAAFLSTGATPGTGPTAFAEVCAWNTSFVPKEDAVELDNNCALHFDFERLQQQAPDFPIVCIDWCDAAAYCAWLGGHLCGQAQGLPMTRSEISSLGAEWYSACSANGTTDYGYGTEFDPLACNTAASGHNGVSIAVASLPTCEGPSPGLFDMNGNADEWVAACDSFDAADAARATCYRVGGAFFHTGAAQSRCASSFPGYRGTHGYDTTVRCCYDR